MLCVGTDGGAEKPAGAFLREFALFGPALSEARCLACPCALSSRVASATVLPVLARCVRDCLACPRQLVLACWSSACLACPALIGLACPALIVIRTSFVGDSLSCLSLRVGPCALCPRLSCLSSPIGPRPLVLACWSSARLACPAPVGSAPVVLPVPSLCPFFVSLLCRSLRLAVPRVARCLAAPGTWFCARLACPGSSPGSGLTAIHNRHNLLPNNGLRPITSAGVCAVVAPKLRRQISGNLAVFSAIATDVGRSICLPSSSRAATTLGRRSPASP